MPVSSLLPPCRRRAARAAAVFACLLATGGARLAAGEILAMADVPRPAPATATASAAAAPASAKPRTVVRMEAAALPPEKPADVRGATRVVVSVPVERPAAAPVSAPPPAPAQDATPAPRRRGGDGGGRARPHNHTSGSGSGAAAPSADGAAAPEDAAPPPEPAPAADPAKEPAAAESEWAKLVSAMTARTSETKEILYHQCRYIAAEDLKAIVNEFLSDTGRAAPAKDSDVLVVEDVPSKLAVIRAICEKVDQRVPQILVEAQIVELKITNDFEKEVNLALVTANAGSFVQNVFSSLTPTGATPMYDARGNLTGNFGGEAAFRPWYRRHGNGSFDSLTAMFRLLETRGKAKILSSPNIVLRRGVTGNIFTGEDYPVAEQNNSGGTVTTTTKFRKIGIGLTVVPRMIQGNMVRLYVKPEVSSLGGTVVSNGTENPIIAMRSVETELEMKDGELLSIGGLLSEDEISEVRKVPGFGSIPGIGGMFRGSDRQIVKKQLAIFLAIRILPEGEPDGVTIHPSDAMPAPAAREIRRIEALNRPDRSTRTAAIHEDWFRIMKESEE